MVTIKDIARCTDSKVMQQLPGLKWTWVFERQSDVPSMLMC